MGRNPQVSYCAVYPADSGIIKDRMDVPEVALNKDQATGTLFEFLPRIFDGFRIPVDSDKNTVGANAFS